MMMIKRFDVRTLFGGGLILLGVLMLLERIGLLHGAANLFWGVALLLAGAYFLYVFAQNPRERWWAIIPSMALLGMAASTVLPETFSGLGGGLFLGGLGLAFMIVYLTDRSRWWGIIPGGVLLTLALVASLDQTNWINSGSLFFVGLGLTFLLVAILPNPSGQMQWAYIPAVVLVLMGALLGMRATAGLADYIWPSALIIVGLVVLVTFFTKKE
jgi:hypothetical protein